MSKRKADLKVVILGAAEVGKTTFIHRYIDGSFKDQISTIGASFSLKQYNGYNIALWDTAGEERFSGLSNFYCRNAGAAILAYDLNDPMSFRTLESRFRPLLDAAELNCLIVVVGMKMDQLPVGTRPIPPEQVMEYAQKINSRKLNKSPYFETSSKTGRNVEEVFDFIFSNCLPEPRTEVPQSPSIGNNSLVNLNDDSLPSKSYGTPQTKRKSGCC